LEDKRGVGSSSCNCRDGTDQKFKYLMFMMMILGEKNIIKFAGKSEVYLNY